MLLLMLHPAKSYHKHPGPVQHRLLYRGLGDQKKHAGQTLNQSMNDSYLSIKLSDKASTGATTQKPPDSTGQFL